MAEDRDPLRDPLIERVAGELRRPESSSDVARAESRARIMAAIQAEGPLARPARPAVKRVRRALRWLAAPRSVRVSPIAGLAMAAAIVWLAMTGRRAPRAGVQTAGTSSATASAGLPAGTRLASLGPGAVQFAFIAPTASRVALVGDFNGWGADANLLRQDPATGVWTAAVRLPPGRYVYAFVIDGRTWVADPTAPRAPDNEFGTPNSVLVVGR